MQENTKKFIKKIKFDIYIYTLLFMILGLGYYIGWVARIEPLMLILASFVFYTIGRQIGLIDVLEAGGEVNTQPRSVLWVRFITYLALMLMVFTVFFT